MIAKKTIIKLNSQLTTAKILRLIVAFLITIFLAIKSYAQASDTKLYTFSWPFIPDSLMQPRGGITQGPKVKLDLAPSEQWRKLTDSQADKKTKDRDAILAMEGSYRTSFDFIETIGFSENYKPNAPYQSWATEYVRVIENKPNFVSLQHILVMHFQLNGGTSEAHVVKHWRQDWKYQHTDLHVYIGHNKWQRKIFSEEEVRGTWTQAVFQVDDSPRYQSIGKWRHYSNHSSWESATTWRPLPRREFSVRNDYNVLIGTNRITITPNGWVHEEDNLKAALDDTGNPRAIAPYLAREMGISRYQLILDYDFSAGKNYWNKTSQFWKLVRTAWKKILENEPKFEILHNVDGKNLYMKMFELADRIGLNSDNSSPEDANSAIKKTLDAHVIMRER